MKKLILTALLLILTFALAACRNGNNGAGEDDIVSNADISAVPSVNLPFSIPTDGFAFMHNGIKIGMGALVSETVENPAFGEPLSIRIEPSCAFEGNDLTFIFSDFTVEAFSFDGIYYVRMINFRNDNVRTIEGLTIGMSLDELLQIYGDDYTLEHGMYSFVRDGSRLAVFVDGGEVVQITYFLILP